MENKKLTPTQIWITDIIWAIVKSIIIGLVMTAMIFATIKVSFSHFATNPEYMQDWCEDVLQ